MKPTPSLRLELRRSRLAATLILASYTATAVLLLSLPLPAGAAIAGGGGIIVACALALGQATGRNAPAMLRLGVDRRIVVITRNARTCHGEILADSFVGHRLTTIVWRPDGARRARTLMIMSDTLTADDFRRLRVALRYGRAIASGVGTSGVDAA